MIALAGCSWLLAACGGHAHKATTPSAPAQTSTSAGQPARSAPSGHGPFRFFSPSSFWNTPVPASAPLDPGSATMVTGLSSEVKREQQAHNGPWINTQDDGVPIVTVTSSQPTVPVTLVPKGNTEPAMRAAWRAVPLPADARPSTGDRDLAVWQPSTDRMWEFFEMSKVGGRWQARWGGAMRNVSADPGVYGPSAWPGAAPNWGVTATSMPLVGGAITLQQLRSGDINHALALTIPKPRAGVFAIPAHRTDGSSSSASALPEGARLRLDPSLNLSSLGLPKPTLAIAEAAQRYGMIVRDTSGVIALAAQDPAPTAADSHGQDPYTGSHGLFAGQLPSALLAKFPWNRLQVLKLDLKHNP